MLVFASGNAKNNIFRAASINDSSHDLLYDINIYAAIFAKCQKTVHFLLVFFATINRYDMIDLHIYITSKLSLAKILPPSPYIIHNFTLFIE